MPKLKINISIYPWTCSNISKTKVSKVFNRVLTTVKESAWTSKIFLTVIIFKLENLLEVKHIYLSLYCHSITISLLDEFVHVIPSGSEIQGTSTICCFGLNSREDLRELPFCACAKFLTTCQQSVGQIYNHRLKLHLWNNW